MQQLVLALALMTPGFADGDQPTAEAVARDAAAPLSFSVTPGVWMIRLRGESSWGGSDLTFDDRLGLDDMEPSFRGEFRVGRDDWGIWVMGTTFSTSGSGAFATNGTWSGLNYAAGQQFDSSFDMTNVAIEGQWNPLDLIGATTHGKDVDPIGPFSGSAHGFGSHGAGDQGRSTGLDGSRSHFVCAVEGRFPSPDATHFAHLFVHTGMSALE